MGISLGLGLGLDKKGFIHREIEAVEYAIDADDEMAVDSEDNYAYNSIDE